MKILLIILSLGLAGAALALRTKVTGKFCAALVCLAVALIVFWPAGGSTQYTHDFEEALGEVFGHAVVDAFPGSAWVLVLLPDGEGEIAEIYNTSNLAGLEKVLSEAGNYEVLVSERADLPQLFSPFGVTVSLLEEKIDQTDVPVDVVVSFVGLPEGEPYEWFKDTRLIARVNRISELDQDWVNSGKCLLVAGVSKTLVPGEEPKGSSAVEVMSQRYETFPPHAGQ